MSLLIGLLFGAGLAVSQMVNPEKVLGFFDVAGDWEPSLGVVMGSALVVSALVHRLVRQRDKPLMSEVFQIPGRRDLDARLIGGAVVFGIGWGLSGLCPGPAVSALATGLVPVVVFVAAMIAGMAVFRWTLQR